MDGALPWSRPDSGKFTGRPSNPLRHLESGRQEPGFPELPIPGHRAGLCLFHRPHGGKAQNQLRQQQSGAPLPDFQKTASGKQAASGIHQTAPMGNALRRGNPWDDKSYEWSNEHVNLPWRRYTAACWAAPYTGHNFFGDTIQGPLFYVPWRDLNTTAETRRSSAAFAAASPISAPWRPRPTASPLIR